MSHTYNYSISQDTGATTPTNLQEAKSLDLNVLKDAISETLDTPENIESDGDDLYITMSEELSSGDKTTLDGILSGYSGDSYAAVEVLVANAITFFDGIMKKFIAENVAWGITASGHTKAVADILANVLRYGQSGSLYEVISEIDLIKLNPLVIAGTYDPYLTISRLNSFKGKVEDFLS